MGEEINVANLLRLTENALRNLIAEKLQEQFGPDWIESCGVTRDRITKWERAKEAEGKKLSTGNLERRLLYFADFTDLQTIILKHWQLFCQVFGDQSEFKVFMSQLEDFRNPNAHNRGIMPFQEQLIAGICGEIRTRIARFRSMKQTSSDCFPRIDNAYDNHGLTHEKQDHSNLPKLRVGDSIEIVVDASDPENLPLEFRFRFFGGGNKPRLQDWSSENKFSIDLDEHTIGLQTFVKYEMRSPRPYHASGDSDDTGTFFYDVLPL